MNIEKLKERAEAGDAEAQNDLGYVYSFGVFGFKKDNQEAVRWFEKSGCVSE